ncbi:hypothetical protein BI375_02075 [Vibrio rotiferianus]|uniref:Uncharacterized protein n=1 Tax=Vibrio rotiferianus TaxID=190895 RepID=A0ABX3DEA8_9VIBR|nr:hypothetical protein [Vibrio rotiferianus]OHY96322.1 hypothetical protein BI375_02075 [Vibrio rotiferianus]
MFNLKQTLLNYQSVFVLGLPTHETYRIFRSLLRDAVRDYMPVSYLDNGSNKTYILFNHDEDIAYVETNEGLMNLREGSNSVEKGEVIYLSVDNRNLPLGFVFVIPPQFKTKNFLADHHSNPFLRDDKRWLKHLYGILWCDAFPYGELTNKHILCGLTNWLVAQRHMPNVHLMLLEGPDTASSDLHMAEEDLSGAYSKEILAGDIVEVSDSSNLKHYFKARFNHRESFLHRQREYIKHQVEKMEDFVSDYTIFSTTYSFCIEDFVEDYISPSSIDQIFSQHVLQGISNQKKYYEYLSKIAMNLVGDYFTHIDEEFFDGSTMPFLNNFKKAGYNLPLDTYFKLVKSKKLKCIESIRSIGDDLSFRNINKLTPLEFIATIKSDKKVFTDFLMEFYQRQCESITLNFLNEQVIHLKSIGKK